MSTGRVSKICWRFCTGQEVAERVCQDAAARLHNRRADKPRGAPSGSSSRLLAEKASDDAQQLERAVGLGHVVVAPGCPCLILVALHRKRADRDDRRGRQLGLDLISRFLYGRSSRDGNTTSKRSASKISIVTQSKPFSGLHAVAGNIRKRCCSRRLRRLDGFCAARSATNARASRALRARSAASVNVRWMRSHCARLPPHRSAMWRTRTSQSTHAA